MKDLLQLTRIGMLFTKRHRFFTASQKHTQKKHKGLLYAKKASVITVDNSLPKNDISLFLHNVAAGKQDEVEAMLKFDNNFVYVNGTITDLANRTFSGITGLQYALWALDWHMWEMLRKHLTFGDIQDQLQQMFFTSWINEHGIHVSWQPLIDSLSLYVEKFHAWGWEKCIEYWNTEVRDAQKKLPAHVVNEYCRLDRTFDPCPSFQESILPRTTFLLEHGDWFQDKYNDNNLENEGAVVRGWASRPLYKTDNPWIGLVTTDMIALKVLFSCRKKQRDVFFNEHLRKTFSSSIIFKNTP